MVDAKDKVLGLVITSLTPEKEEINGNEEKAHGCGHEKGSS